MITQETIRLLQHAPLVDRIQMIEMLLETVKHDLGQTKEHRAYHVPFQVHTFDLGVDISLDRDEMYAERGV